MKLYYKINNLEFTGTKTMNYGEIEIFVNNRFLTYLDLDNFGYDYKKFKNKDFIKIIDKLLYEIYQFNEIDLIDLDDFNE